MQDNHLQLKAEIDNTSGFCFGVTNAIRMAEELLEANKTVYCIGQIVHNDEEVKRLEKKGLKTIDYKELNNIYDSYILFRAHGEPPSTYKKVIANNNTIIDASCPIIIRLQKKVKDDWDMKKNIYIFGKKNHPEVVALIGQTDNNAAVFESIEEFKKKEHTLPKEITLYSQTTKSVREFNEITAYLVKKGFILKSNDTICRQFSNRESHIFEFCIKFDKVVFIAGRNSSNGKVLFAKCKEANPHSHFVSSLVEIERKWFKPNEKVGVCGATSTPHWLMEKAKDLIERL